MLLVLYGVQQYQAEQRMQAQLQQYADLLRVSLRPFLASSSADQLSNQLLELQYSALLPITAIGIYLPGGEPLASAGLSHTLPTHLSPNLVKNYQLQLFGTREAAVLPLFSQSNAVEHVMPFQSSGGYLVIVPDVLADRWQFLPTTATAWLIYTLLFLITGWYAHRWLRQRQIWLASLFDHSDVRLSTQSTTENIKKLPAELQVIHWHFTKLTDQLVTHQELQQHLTAELQKLEQIHLKMSEQQHHTEQQLQSLQKNINQWLTHTQLIWHRQEQLSHPVFFALMRLQLLYGLYQFNPPQLTRSSMQLSDWLASEIPQLNHLLPQGVSIDWLEGQDNNSVAIMLDGALVEAILQALILLALRSDNLTRLSIRLRILRKTNSQLEIHLKCDGHGLAVDLNEQLKSGQMPHRQWSDIDLAILQRFAHELAADLKVQSLEGLGLSIVLNIPVQTSELPFVTKIGHILLFDEDTERLHERVTMLRALAIQVTYCKNRSDMLQILSKTTPDLLLLMLPSIAPNDDWLTLIRQTQRQLSSHVFASASHLAQWQALISCNSATEFCIALIQKLSQPVSPLLACKNLLVVDDNETNQAFIRILLQHKAVNIHSALTGTEVLQLCQQQQFDLILLDISLPDISGIEVARQLRRLPTYLKTPILAFTAHALPAEIAEFKLAGMDDILLKPLDPGKFETLLARYQLY
ncbi:hypothetical protein GCM10010919_13100 [Alishewanella longhuensis]|uniref:Response regulatory domain-containing protein n=1 Tax=Alishewanella longhuensis TaxID=1091037 RepID=A0ABQ3KY05_9ALTE|nr:hypothetical protein GCM10010919_13100 [Alishewanella longhuensis]